MNRSFWQYTARLIAFGLCYAVAAQLGLWLRTVGAGATLLWPPSGLALAVFTLFGIRHYWPGIFLGAIITAILAGEPLVLGIVGGGISIVGAISGTYLLRRTGFDPSLTQIKDVLILLILGVFISSLIGSVVGALLYCLTDNILLPYCGPVWWTWWLGDAMGILIFSPLLFAWYASPRPNLSSSNYLEISALIAATIIVNRTIFGDFLGDNSAIYPLAYVTLPLSFWAAMRFGQPGATTINLLIIGMAIWGTLNGNGPFARSSLQESLILIWLFMGVTAITAVFVAAVTCERRKAEKTLRKERDFAMQVMNTLGQGVVVINNDGIIEYVNPAMGRLLETAPTKMIGQTSIDFVYPEDRHLLQNQFELRRQGKATTYELRLQPVSGNPVDVLLTGTPRLEQERHTGSIIVATDLTDRKQAEREFFQLQERFLLAFHANPSPISITRLSDGLFVDVNDSYLTTFHYSRDQLIGHTVTETSLLLSPPDRSEIISLLKQRNGFKNLEVTLRSGQNKSRFTLASMQVIEINKELHVLAMFNDITERVVAENALRESEERYRIIAQIISNIAYIYRVTEQQKFQRIWATEEAVIKITGYTYQEIDDMGGWTAIIVPEDRDAVRQHQRQLLTGQDSNIEYRFFTKMGEICWLQDFASPVWDSRQARVTHIYGAGQTITERKNLEAQLYQSQKLEAIGRLAGGIAHDFNNILTVIIGNAELLLELVADDEPLRKDIEQIHKLGNRAAALTRQLLAFSRQQVLNPLLVNLNVIITDMRDMLHRLIGEDITLTAQLAPNLWKTRSDPSQLEQVILNLVVNARDAMPDGGDLIIKTANISPTSANYREFIGMPPGNHILLSVVDTGVGMDSATLSHIFEPFYTTKETGKGTGLGLATIHGIVTQSGGHIWVDSLPNQGTTFNIYLPATLTSETIQPAPVKPLPDVTVSANILLVEDEESVRDVVRRTLANTGHTVLEAENGEAALQIARKSSAPIQLLLTDIVVPGGTSGYQLAQQMLQEWPHLKIIYMSGYTQQKLTDMSASLPIEFFLQKPFSSQHLLDTVQLALNSELPH